MDEAEQLLARLQNYVPFLKDMIENLKSDMPQHSKIVALHSMITERKKKFKLDTLKKCEEVILKMQSKTQYKTVKSKEETPRSPSPQMVEIGSVTPKIIPSIRSPDDTWSLDSETSERTADRYVKEKPSVYSCVAETINKPRTERLKSIIPPLDTSKPPISVADLELLKSDVMGIMDHLAIKSPTKPQVEIKAIKKPSKVSLVPAPIMRPKTLAKNKNDSQTDGKAVATEERKSEVKSSPKTELSERKEKPKVVEKIIKEADSTFGNMLSSIDDKLIGDKKKRRDSKESGKLEDKKKVDNVLNLNEETTTDILINQLVLNKNLIKSTCDSTADKKAENDDAKIYKRLADKYNPKPRKQSGAIPPPPAPPAALLNSLNSSLAPPLLREPVPQIIQNITPRPSIVAAKIPPQIPVNEMKMPQLIPEIEFDEHKKVDPRLNRYKHDIPPDISHASHFSPPDYSWETKYSQTFQNDNMFGNYSNNSTYQQNQNQMPFLGPPMNTSYNGNNSFRQNQSQSGFYNAPTNQFAGNMNNFPPRAPNRFGLLRPNFSQNKPFSPFEPINHEYDLSVHPPADYYPPSTNAYSDQQHSNNYHSGHHDNKRNNFNNYNRFGNQTYKSWREERESKDPRLSRRDEFRREKSREPETHTGRPSTPGPRRESRTMFQEDEKDTPRSRSRSRYDDAYKKSFKSPDGLHKTDVPDLTPKLQNFKIPKKKVEDSAKSESSSDDESDGKWSRIRTKAKHDKGDTKENKPEVKEGKLLKDVKKEKSSSPDKSNEPYKRNKSVKGDDKSDKQSNDEVEEIPMNQEKGNSRNTLLKKTEEVPIEENNAVAISTKQLKKGKIVDEDIKPTENDSEQSVKTNLSDKKEKGDPFQRLQLVERNDDVNVLAKRTRSKTPIPKKVTEETTNTRVLRRSPRKKVNNIELNNTESGSDLYQSSGNESESNVEKSNELSKTSKKNKTGDTNQDNVDDKSTLKSTKNSKPKSLLGVKRRLSIRGNLNTKKNDLEKNVLNETDEPDIMDENHVINKLETKTIEKSNEVNQENGEIQCELDRETLKKGEVSVIEKDQTIDKKETTSAMHTESASTSCKSVVEDKNDKIEKLQYIEKDIKLEESSLKTKDAIEIRTNIQNEEVNVNPTEVNVEKVESRTDAKIEKPQSTLESMQKQESSQTPNSPEQIPQIPATVAPMLPDNIPSTVQAQLSQFASAGTFSWEQIMGLINIVKELVVPKPEIPKIEAKPEEKAPEVKPEEIKEPEVKPEEIKVPEVKPEEIKAPEVKPEEIKEPEEVVDLHVQQTTSNENLETEVDKEKDLETIKKPTKRYKGKDLMLVPSPSETSDELDDSCAINATKFKKPVIKKPRRSELDKLHENIKETIGDDVLTSNKRACTVQKETNIVEPNQVIVENMLERARGLRVVLHKLPDLRKRKNEEPRMVCRRKSMSKALEAIHSFVDDEDEPLEKKTKIDGVETITEEDDAAPESSKHKIKKKRKSVWLSGYSKKKKRVSKKEETERVESEEEDDMITDELDVEDDDEVESTEIPAYKPDKHYYYVFDKQNDCKLCSFSGSKLIYHYLTNHPENEVLISRLPPDETEKAILESVENNYEAIEATGEDGKRRLRKRYNFKCRFCKVNLRNETAVVFYDHISTHTGEWRFECHICMSRFSVRPNALKHYRRNHPGVSPKYVCSNPPPNFHLVFGYVCSSCNYVQTSKENVLAHIHKYHSKEMCLVHKISLTYTMEQNSEGLDSKDDEDSTLPTESIVEEVDSIEVDKIAELDAEINAMNDSNLAPLIDIVRKPRPKSKQIKILEPQHETNSIEEKGPQSIDMNKDKQKRPDKAVFMCDSDILSEAVRLEEMRLKIMNRIHDSITPKRTSFINQLKSRLDSEITSEQVVENAEDPVGEMEEVIEPTTPIPDEIVKDLPISTDEITLNDSPTAETQVTEPLRPKQSSGPKLVPLSKLLAPSNKRDSVSNTVNRLQGKLNESKSNPVTEPEFIDLHESSDQLTQSACDVTMHDNTSEIKIKDEPEDMNLPKLHKLDLALESSLKSAEKIISVTIIEAVIDRDHSPLFICRKPSCIFRTVERSIFAAHCSLTHHNESSVLSCSVCAINARMRMADVFSHLCQHVDANVQEVIKDVSEIKKESDPDEDVIIVEDEAEAPKFSFKITSVTSLAPKKVPDLVTTSADIPPLVPLTFSNQSQLPSPTIATTATTTTPSSCIEAASPQPTSPPISNLPQQVTCKVIAMTKSEIMKTRKNPEVMEKWLRPDILERLFKCPEYNCSFTTSKENYFDFHLKTHPEMAQRQISCLYCNFKMRDYFIKIHCMMKHSKSRYGCVYCLYRAHSKEYVRIHQEVMHPGNPIKSLTFTQVMDGANWKYKSVNLPKIACLLKPYKCCCNAEFFVIKNFENHLLVCTSPRKLFCGRCKILVTKKNGLVEHYVKHEVFEYHCRYCSYGSSMSKTVLRHIALEHSFQPVNIICRRYSNPSDNSEEDGSVFNKLECITVSPSSESSQAVASSDSPVIPNDNITPSSTSNNLKKDKITIISSQTITPVEVSKPEIVIIDDLDSSTEVNSDPELETPNKNIKSLIGKDLFKCNKCRGAFDNSTTFKTHLNTCIPYFGQNRAYVCYHCKKSAKHLHSLLLHYKHHGAARITCSLCPYVGVHQFQLRLHMKTKHKISEMRLVPVDPNKSDHDSDEFICVPGHAHLTQQKGEDKPSIVAVTSKESSTTESQQVQKTVFSPDEMNLLPIRAIYNHNVSCSICNFQTKVRMNLVRHMHLHNSNQKMDISAKVPVNPVPCLEKNELMFDKMTNLALSSHATGRMGGVKNEEVEYKPPAFVPLTKRYVCCANNCNYLCLKESMLRHHLQALHSDEKKYVCVHCNEDLSDERTSIQVENVIQHLRGHEGTLYKCCYCPHLNNHKGRMERHCLDKHRERGIKFIIVRERNDDDGYEMAGKEKKSKPWRCCMCKWKFSTVQEISTHTENKHGINSQYKCSYCTYKSDDKDSFKEHFSSKHVGLCEDIVVVYFNEETSPQPSKEPVISLSEAFDTTPLWVKNKTNQVKHIRGILLEEQEKVSKKSPIKLAPIPDKNVGAIKRISSLDLSIDAVATGVSTVDVQTLQKGRKRKSMEEPITTTSTVVDTPTEFTCTNNLVRLDLNDPSNVIIKVEPLDPAETMDADSGDSGGSKSLTTKEINNMGIDQLASGNFMGEFGPYGKPFDNQFRCPLCSHYMTMREKQFYNHLCEDLEYFRYGCSMCSNKESLRDAMQQHCLTAHQPDVSTVELQSHNTRVEKWVNNVILYQRRLIGKDTASPQNLDDLLLCQEDDSILTSSDSRPSTPFMLNDSDSGSSSRTVMAGGRLAKVTHWVCCEHCDYLTNKELVMAQHKLRHWKRKPFKCGLCDFEGVTRYYVVQHAKQKHVNQPYTVVEVDIGDPVIQPIVHSRRASKFNLMFECQNILYMCKQCDSEYSSLAELKDHHLQQHSAPLTHFCSRYKTIYNNAPR